jgi:TatD DNase family protein
MGWYISFAGVITYKNASKTLESVIATPKDRILVETDCPYLAPVPYRGKRNDSSKLSYVAEELAAIKQVSVEEVIRITNENGRKLYHI